MDWLEAPASAIEHLDGVVIVQLPDCVAWNHWTRSSWDASEVAAYFGDITRANRNAMKTVGAGGEEVRLTIESDTQLILTCDLNESLVAVYIFSKKIQLGMARLHSKRLGKEISKHLPTGEVIVRSRAERIMEFLTRYAPDPHALPMRVSLQTRIPLDKIRNPAQLDEAQTVQLENAAKAILGVKTLRI